MTMKTKPKPNRAQLLAIWQRYYNQQILLLLLRNH